MTHTPPQEQTEPCGAPSIEDARRMGETGGKVAEAERLAFEAWMAGHCWALSAAWTGSQYLGSSEGSGDLCPRAVRTRQLWAAWRDRAALAKAKGPGEQHRGPEAGQEPPTHAASVAALQREVEELRVLLSDTRDGLCDIESLRAEYLRRRIDAAMASKAEVPNG